LLLQLVYTQSELLLLRKRRLLRAIIAFWHCGMLIRSNAELLLLHLKDRDVY
jgi:hypothetical protein